MSFFNNDNEVEIDNLDKASGIKKKLYKNNELAEQRFKASYKILCFLAFLNIFSGAMMIFMERKNVFFEYINGYEVITGGLIYLIFIFLFYKLKMPLLLVILALCMLLEKIYIMTITKHLMTPLSIIISLFLIVSIIQALRSKIYIEKIDKKKIKYLVSIIFFILIIIVLLGNTSIFSKDEEWSKDILTDFENTIYEQFYINLVISSKEDEKAIIEISKYTANCSVIAIQKEYPNYTEFLELLIDKREYVIKNIDEMKNYCFEEALKKFANN